MPDPTSHAWSTLPTDTPMPGIDRQRVIGSHVMVSRVTLAAGVVVPPHRHANEQIAIVESGRMRFTLGEASDRIVELGAGEVLHLPPDAPHGAEAIETSVILDVFSPPSEKTGIDD
ncbi:MAG: hypothetical protein DHS20C14_05810 [Phycisphaeraceae bacterium]|nr:MAG: hypothetical protein DHS20C14_05810 [Phycisphaeraceae bacterium]